LGKAMVDAYETPGAFPTSAAMDTVENTTVSLTRGTFAEFVTSARRVASSLDTHLADRRIIGSLMQRGFLPV
jgi:hypothetical protein